MKLPDLAGMSVVNQATIDELSQREKDGRPLLHRLFEIYLEETPRLLEELERAVAAGDVEGCYDAIHQMKGSAAAMGATRLFTLTEAALQLCRDDAVLGVLDLVERLESESDLYVRELSAKLEGS